MATREPGGTHFGIELRRILLARDGAPRSPLAELLIYLADRCQHLEEVIEPALSRQQHVLCDRYHDATLAYQGYARGIGFAPIDELANVLRIRIPDLTLVLDLDVATALARARSRNSAEGSELWGRFEFEDIEFHERVRQGYQLLAERDRERICLIDGSGDREQVFSRILDVISRKKILPALHPSHI